MNSSSCVSVLLGRATPLARMPYSQADLIIQGEQSFDPETALPKKGNRLWFNLGKEGYTCCLHATIWLQNNRSMKIPLQPSRQKSRGNGFKAIIIDADEPLARSIVNEHLQSFNTIEVVQECSDGLKRLGAIPATPA